MPNKKTPDSIAKKLPPKPYKETSYKASTQIGLLDFLLLNISEKSRSKIKSLLTTGQVWVNDKNITQFDHPLVPGDSVCIRRETSRRSDGAAKKSGPTRAAGAEATVGNIKMSGIRILFEDNDLIVIDKPAGLLSVSQENERTAYNVLTEYSRAKNVKNHIFVLHRLDRETSGVMMFAKNKRTQDGLQRVWDQAVTERKYIVIVEGAVPSENGTITTWLKENKSRTMYSSKVEIDGGQKAVTHWRVLKSSTEYTMLQAELETGRKNQIRVHMQDMDHSVVGDTKYGAKTDPIKRLGLHAHSLAFVHPESGKKMRFESPVPIVFGELFAQQNEANTEN